jgi:rod shape-determining protein MreC
VKQHPGMVGRLATLRLLAQRFAFLTLVLASFALMLLGKADTIVVERLRVLIDDGVSPVLQVLSRPASAVASVVNARRECPAGRGECPPDALADGGA